MKKIFGCGVALGVALLAGSASAKEALVFVSAHADDTDGFAATAMLLKERYDIHVVDVCHGDYELGEKGVKDDPSMPPRMKEELAACAYAGFTPHFLSEPDANACASDKSANQLAEIFRKTMPRAVFTHWPIDRHADHVQCAALVARALVRAGLAPAPGQPMPPNASERYFFEEWIGQTKNFHTTYSVDVTSTISNKVEMLRCYASQNQGDNGLVNPTLDRLAKRGSVRTPPCAYAEIFATYDGEPISGGVLETLNETAAVGDH